MTTATEVVCSHSAAADISQDAAAPSPRMHVVCAGNLDAILTL